MSNSQLPDGTAGLQRKVIQDVGEVPLVLYGDARTPLAEQSFLRRALVLAELAMIAYNDEDEAQRAAEAIGFLYAQLADRDGSQAYVFGNERDIVLACRGTEVTEWNDIQADANAVMSVVGSLGKVHSGFNREVDDLWPVLEEVLRDDGRTVWFCGHSLGGAMATICAYRCTTSSLTSSPRELHTFGSPRVGCKRYVRHAAVTHYRWVHNNDIVTRVPPVWMGYRHSGDEVYLNRHGRIRKLRGVLRSRDRWRGMVAGLLRGKIDMLSDHSIGLYAGHIATAVEEEVASPGRHPGGRSVEDLVIRDESEETPQRDSLTT